MNICEYHDAGHKDVYFSWITRNIHPCVDDNVNENSYDHNCEF